MMRVKTVIVWTFAMVLASGGGGIVPARGQERQNEDRRHVIESVTSELSQARGVEAAPPHNTLRVIASPVRAGRAAFEHTVTNDGGRSELAMRRVETNRTYWYGWSTYVPGDLPFRGSGTIIMQMAAWPTERRFPGGGIGHKIYIDGSGRLMYTLHYPGAENETRLLSPLPELGSFEEIRDLWTDFVLHARWTPKPDGFLRLWMQRDGAGYRKVLDYEGPTWFDDANRGRQPGGPYFKMGAYMGGSGWGEPGDVRRVITAEYRLGTEQARFEDVAPGTAPVVVQPTPMGVEIESPQPYQTATGILPIRVRARAIPEAQSIDRITVTVRDKVLHEGRRPADDLAIDTLELDEGYQYLEVHLRTSGGGRASATVPIVVRNQPLRDCGDLIAYYPFSEGSGSLVQDRSGCAEPIDLRMTEPEGMEWLAERNGVRFSGTRYAGFLSDGPAAKLRDAILESGQFTVELWLQTGNVEQRGPARVFQYGGIGQNLMIGQNGREMQIRLCTGHEGRQLYLNAGRAPTNETHYVVTYDGSSLRVYENGRQVGSRQVEADFAAWDRSHVLSLGNEIPPLRLRPWKGTLYSAAVSSRAWSADEIAERFARRGRNRQSDRVP